MSKTQKKFKEEIKSELLGILLVGISIYLFWIIFHYPSLGPYSLPEDSPGMLGGFIVRVLTYLIGMGRFVFPLVLLFSGVKVIYSKTGVTKLDILIFSLFLMALLAIFHLNSLSLNDLTLKNFLSTNGSGGGIIGGLLSWLTFKILGIVGSYIFLISLSIACILYLTKLSFKVIFQNLGRLLKKFFSGFKKQLEDFIFVTVEEPESKPVVDDKQLVQENNDDDTPVIINRFDDSEHNKVSSSPIKKEKKTSLKEKNDDEFIPLPQSLDNENFILPSINMLEKTKRSANTLSQKDINENIHILQKTLESFGVEGKVVQVSCGPTITRYEFQPAPGIKVSRIVNLADDIALSLAAAGVRIEAPIPGKAAIGIEVPNREIATVSLREVIESEEFQNSSSKLTVALGKDVAGKPTVTDLAKMPHLLIAGATGSGKSVCMNALITSILFKAKPSEVKFLMIDPKMVELTTYNGIPHLITPVVTDPKKAASALRWAVHEMENRYELFAAAGVKDMVRYNMLVTDSLDTEKHFLPQIVILIDELADLMMVAPADVEDSICRLAQMARAAGIHLVVATQRPSVDVITGIIKANIPSRIAFAVSSQTDSRTILDMNGAEKLLGRGDMLFYPTGYPKPVRLQGVFVSDREVEKIVQFLKEQEVPEYIEEITNQDLEADKNIDESEEEDELIPQAAKLFIENGQASISLLQRRFRIGYTRAARIIDQMEDKGIIGPYEGSKPRQVLITIEDYERLFGDY
ncbi:MAG: DNA translocase FtsK [Clostridia bacterium]|nr:DNA translocase FtsK [Clostridia bacterium]